MKIHQRALPWLTVLLTVISIVPRGHRAWGQQAPVRTTVQVAVGSDGVATDSPHATRVGQDILQAGGNAVDAAVAVAFALAVTWPEAGNIGGGGFMMVLPAPGKAPMCVEYREQAPSAATRTMFRRNDSRHSWKIVGVPGTVRGLQLAHETYGKLPWSKLVQPAIQLASDGFEMDSFLARSLNSVLLATAVNAEFKPLRAAYGCPEHRAWKAGDRLVLPQLASTLRAIAEDADAFYVGPLAERLAEAAQQGGGLITTDDLANYEAKLRKPIHGRYRGFDVWGPPPPSSGGICLVEALNILSSFKLGSREVYSVENVHLRAEAMRRAFVDRATHLGDSDFVDIPARLTSPKYAAKLAQDISLQHATPSEQLAPHIPLAKESDSTTHFSIVDQRGMAVSNTYTLEASWGSRRLVPRLGYVLNNEMGDFNWTPGYTDRRGRIGTRPNQIEPGKRMLSSQTPTLITQDGKLAFAIGSPGGRTIINTVLGIALDVMAHERPLPVAVAAPRMHHQWLPDVLRFEAAKAPEYQDLVRQLRGMGHNVVARRQGSAHCIAVLPNGKVQAVADFRRGGAAAATP